MSQPIHRFILSISLFAVVATVLAQVKPPVAKVTGLVIDGRTGKTIPGAPVEVQGPGLAGKGNSAISGHADADGRFSFSIPPGPYDLTASGANARGSRDFSSVIERLADGRWKVELTAGGTVNHDFVLLPEQASDAYRVETLDLPHHMVPETAGVTFTPQGSLVVLTRRGEVWIRPAQSTQWRRFASGLSTDGFGVWAASEQEIYVSQRPELTRITDSNGDGVADVFETLSDDWGMTGNYHEFTYGLARDSHGNFFGGLGLASNDGGSYKGILTRGPLRSEMFFPGETYDPHRPLVKYQGWVYEVTKAGEFIPFASGFRQTLGVGVSPRDELFVTDVSGTWIPTSVFTHVEKGHFYGNPESLKWDPTFEGKKLSYEEILQMRTPPTIYIPRGALGNAPGQPAWDTTNGKFGPFPGQIFLGDWMGMVNRIDLERVGGAYQGAIFTFLHSQGLRPGTVRAAFAPDGSLYVGQTLRGWGSTANEGIQRIVWTGKVPVEIQTMRLRPGGFTLTFTTPMRQQDLANTRSFRVRRFQYKYSIDDGSLPRNEADIAVTAAIPRPDGLAVDITLEELVPDFIYEVTLDTVKNLQGLPVANPTVWYTANRLLAGQTVVKSIVKPKVEDTHGPIDVSAGEKIFTTTCIVCHQADGRGLASVGTPNFTSPTGPLQKPDAALIAQIVNGSKVMPPFGNTLPARDIRNVLGYIRKAFGSHINLSSP